MLNMSLFALNILDLPCEREGYFRYRNSCSLHYRCFYSKRCGKIISSRVYECPGCLKFHIHKMICDLPENVPECTYHEKKYQDIEGHQVTDPVTYCTGPGVFLDPSNRMRYFDCVDIFERKKYYLTIKTCPDDLNFNDATKTCDHTVGSNLPSMRHIPGSCSSDNYAVDRYKCDKFYYCRNGVPQAELFCMDNYFFNGNFCQHNNSTSCNWKELNQAFKQHKV